jgi:hypothetical protein
MFPGFALDDFEPYRQERASSNVYNRPRLAVKEKLLEILHAAEPDLRARRPDLETGAADHVPNLRNNRKVDAQWGYFWRTADERPLVEEVIEGSRGVAEMLADPPTHHRHALLCAVIDTESFSLGVRVSGRALVDAANLRAVLGDDAGRAALLEALHALPQPFTFIVPGRGPLPAREARTADLDAFLAAFPEDGEARFEVARTWPKADAAMAGSGLLARAHEELVALEPLFSLASWARSHDRIGFDALLERIRAERAHEEEEHEREQKAFAGRKAEVLAAGRERLERMVADRTPGMTRAGTREIALPAPPAWMQPPPGRRPRREETPAAPPAEAQAPAPQPEARPVEAKPAATAETQPVRPAPTAPSAPPRETYRRPPERRPEHRPGGPSRGPSQPQPIIPHRPEHVPMSAVTDEPGLVPGKLVRFRQGPLRGRVGTLFEIGPKGEARVMLGLFTTRVPMEHLLEVRRRDRAPESSSAE